MGVPLSPPASTPRLPDYADACVCNIVPALLQREPRAWLPDAVVGAPSRTLLVIDGLGWEQLDARRSIAPNLAAMSGGAIDTVAPSTTAVALTSISTGRPPAQHGIVGIKMRMQGKLLNTLHWTLDGQDARERVVPEHTQAHAPFLGAQPPVVSRYELRGSGFGEASLRGADYRGYKVLSSLPLDVAALAREATPFIYAYYDGIDKIAHQRGLSDHYDAELRVVDQIVGQVLARLPKGSALVVTADHGHVDVRDAVKLLAPELTELVEAYSGEPRFRWLHAKPGVAPETLVQLAREHHGQHVWVASRQQVIDEGWLGPAMPAAIAERCGDVCMVARDRVTLLEQIPEVMGKYGRHGGLAPGELRVPLLHAVV